MNRRRSTVGIAFATLALLLVVGLYVLIYFVYVPALEVRVQDSTLGGLERGIEVEMPERTQFVLDTYLYWSVFLIAGFGGHALVFWYGNRRG